MAKDVLRLWIIGCLLAAAPSAWAQDTSGSWMITAETQAQEQVDALILICKWTGTWNVMESGGMLSGMVTLNLDATAKNDQRCPDPLTATLSGTNDMGVVSGTLSDPVLGDVSFQGQLANAAPFSTSASSSAAVTATGSFSVSGGQSAGNAGTWSGTQAPVAPTIPQLGQLTLLLALFAGGSYFLLRRRRA